jgi:hypothetical protein
VLQQSNKYLKTTPSDLGVFSIVDIMTTNGIKEAMPELAGAQERTCLEKMSKSGAAEETAEPGTTGKTCSKDVTTVVATWHPTSSIGAGIAEWTSSAVVSCGGEPVSFYFYSAVEQVPGAIITANFETAGLPPLVSFESQIMGDMKSRA